MSESEALEALHAILARPEFATTRAGRSLLEVWTTAIREWLWDLLLGFVRPVGEVLSPQRSWIDLALLVGALVATAGIGWVVLRAVGMSVVREAREDARVAAARRARSDELWRQAQELAAQGRLAEAARSLYLSALYALEEHAVLQVQESLTNREHAERILGEQTELSSVFERLVQRYDRLRYGTDEVDRDTFEELNGLVDRTRALTA